MAAAVGVFRVFLTKSGRVLRIRNIPKRMISEIKETETPSPESEEEFLELYPNHIPTTFTQKCLLSLGSAAMAITDPFRDDMVAVLGETTGHNALSKMLNKMKNHPEGLEILRNKPGINSETVNLDSLRCLPEGSFGNIYATFMDKHEITADSRQPVHFVDDPDLAYVMQRYRETHDLVHALLDMPTNMLGEVTVKWVEALQTELPMCIAAAVLGPVRLKPKQLAKYKSTWLPWAINCGLHSEFLMNVYYEKRWEQNVDELRLELKIPPFPKSV